MARSPRSAPTKLALIVAIGAYETKSGYPRLETAHDVVLVRDALIAQGFDSLDIRVIEDSQATRDGILAGFQWLEDRARTGDVVVFHYSGHGHQITDTTGLELDGLDEMLVPWGAPGDTMIALQEYGLAHYRGERHLLDKTLGPILTSLRRKVGPTGNVAWFVDACFSGSITRAIDIDQLPVRSIRVPIQFPFHRSGAAGGVHGPPGFDLGDSSDPSLSPYVVISAAQYNHLDQETLDAAHDTVGPLSLAISHTFPQIDSLATYRELFERVSNDMSTMQLGSQQPQIEGNPDTRVFNGRAVSPPRYFTVKNVIDDTLVRINAGELVGIHAGTTLQFRAPGTHGTAIDSGVVRTAAATSAVVRLSASVAVAAIRSSWAFVTAYTYGEFRIGVGLDPDLSPAVATRLRAALSTATTVTLETAAPQLRVSSPAGRLPAGHLAITLTEAASGSTIATLSGPADSVVATLRSELLAIARSLYFRSLDLRDPSGALRFTLEVIPSAAPIRQAPGGPSSCPDVADTVTTAARRTGGGVMELAPGSVYWLRVGNAGAAPAYFNIFDLQPDYAIKALYPSADDVLSDIALGPADLVMLPHCYRVTLPYGLETLKLFATQSPIDLRPVFTPGISRRSIESPLDALLATAADAHPVAQAVPPGDAATATATIRVAPGPLNKDN